MGHRVAERLELAVDRCERGGALFDQHLELAAVTPQLLLGAVELDEDRHLRPDDGGYDGCKNEVDRSEVVAAAHIRLRLVERGDEDDRRQLRTRALADELGGLKSVHDRHANVEQHDGELIAQ